LTVPRTLGPVFLFCAPGIIFGGPEGVGSLFLLLRSRTRFQRYQGRRVSFSCFALPDSFSAVPRASRSIFKFSATGHVFGGTEGVGSRFYVLRDRSHIRWYRGRRSSFLVLRSRTHFRRYRGCRVLFSFFSSRTHFRRYRGRLVLFSCLALPNSFSTVQRVSGPFFMFCASGLVFDGTEGVGTRFHVICSRTHFRLYRGRPFPFSCFSLPYMFSVISSASGPVFIFSAPGHVFEGTDGVGSRFHVLRSRTLFRPYRGRLVPFSCIPLPDIFSAVLRASGPVFFFCARGIILGGTKGVGSRFYVLRSRTRFQRYRGRRGPVFMFCAPGLVFGGTVGVGSRFHVLPAQTLFRRYRGRQIPFFCFLLPKMFSAVPRASAPVFMFCVPGLVFGGTEGIGSRFLVLCARTRFRR
jgi:hypothetical protein